jgi:bifunctional non-homologous end joining protein LigD
MMSAVSDWLDRLEERERAAVRPAAEPPAGTDAMKATLSRAPFSHPDWIFERKLDGVRCIATRSHGEVRLLSRNGLRMNERYPEIAPALARQACPRFALDGEIVAFAGEATSFARLADRRHAVPVFLYAFDLLWLDGADLRELPLRARKRLLGASFQFTDPLRLSAYRNEAGEAMVAEACQRGWEGVIAKRADSPYGARRSRDWLKFKCEQGQEFVIGGYTEPRGSRIEFGALLLGYHDTAGALRYAGKVGTGFDRAGLRELGERLRALGSREAPFADAGSIRERAVSWVAPELVAQVAFTEWTGAGRLRHPRFLGLREDKAAREVVRELPEAVAP